MRRCLWLWVVGCVACSEAGSPDTPNTQLFPGVKSVALEVVDTLTISPQPIFEIGRDDRGGVLFQDVGDLALDPETRTIAVADPEAPAVTLLEPGPWTATVVGREGPGPGEFMAPNSVAFLETNLLILDQQQHRLTELPIADSGARPLTHDLDWLFAEGASEWRRALRTIRVVQGEILLGIRSDPVLVPPDSQFAHIVEIDLDSRTADTLFRFPVPGWVGTVRQTQGSRTSNFDRPPVFSAETFWAPMSNGSYAIVDGARGEIIFIGGSSPVRVTVPMNARPVERDDRIRWLKYHRQRAPGGNNFPLALLERLTKGRFASTLPVFNDARPGPTGGVYVQLFSLSDNALGRSREWIEVTPQGVGRLLIFPEGFQPMLFDNGMVAGSFSDTFDRQWVGALPHEEGNS